MDDTVDRGDGRELTVIAAACEGGIGGGGKCSNGMFWPRQRPPMTALTVRNDFDLSTNETSIGSYTPLKLPALPTPHHQRRANERPEYRCSEGGGSAGGAENRKGLGAK